MLPISDSLHADDTSTSSRNWLSQRTSCHQPDQKTLQYHKRQQHLNFVESFLENWMTKFTIQLTLEHGVSGIKQKMPKDSHVPHVMKLDHATKTLIQRKSSARKIQPGFVHSIINFWQNCLKSISNNLSWRLLFTTLNQWIFFQKVSVTPYPVSVFLVIKPSYLWVLPFPSTTVLTLLTTTNTINSEPVKTNPVTLESRCQLWPWVLKILDEFFWIKRLEKWSTLMRWYISL
jgi:hypothetical protein